MYTLNAVRNGQKFRFNGSLPDMTAKAGEYDTGTVTDQNGDELYVISFMVP